MIMSKPRAVNAIDMISSEKRAYERHRTRVKTAISTVDMNPPKPRPHVIRDAKRLQLQYERQTEIIRNNFILLRNLQDIMHERSRKKNCLHERR
ncbi:hypothetical protein PV328_010077 [Microctonus aethiopoides]|uniref:Uncharacterized protein n=1 Tax=Microctonus aethiopoides TaxID=144406 RepID=A0AA39C774_9HYME|nr:hypothetical protein PV328_010077 [Microctonus aethiopoides]